MEEEQGAAPNVNQGVAMMIQHRVRPDGIDRYERWLKVIGAKAAEYPGHRGLQINRPRAGGTEYTLVVYFATLADAERWASSGDRKRLVEQINDVFEHEDRVQIHPRDRILVRAADGPQGAALEAVADNDVGDMAADHGGAASVPTAVQPRPRARNLGHPARDCGCGHRGAGGFLDNAALCARGLGLAVSMIKGMKRFSAAVFQS